MIWKRRTARNAGRDGGTKCAWRPGVSDFFGVILGTVCILVLIALLVSLLNWLHADIAQNFALWQNKL